MVPLKILALHIIASATADITFTGPEIKSVRNKTQIEERLITADLPQFRMGNERAADME